MELHRVILTKEKLAAMPQAERSLLLLLGHASNEINVLSKLILMMRKGEAPSQLVDHVEAGQIFILMRVLIGKLHEAWLLYKKRVQADRIINDKFVPHLSQEATTALAKLNDHFGRGTPITKIRNKASFHYTDNDNLAEENFQRLPATEPWEFYLTKSVGNSFYFAAELVAAGTAINLAKDQADPSSTALDAFGDLCDDVIFVSGQITELFGSLISDIVMASIPDVEVKIEQLPDGPKISTFCLPFYFDENDSLTPQAKS